LFFERRNYRLQFSFKFFLSPGTLQFWSGWRRCENSKVQLLFFPWLLLFLHLFWLDILVEQAFPLSQTMNKQARFVRVCSLVQRNSLWINLFRHTIQLVLGLYSFKILQKAPNFMQILTLTPNWISRISIFTLFICVDMANVAH
jgi:hypothetical protein